MTGTLKLFTPAPLRALGLIAVCALFAACTKSGSLTSTSVSSVNGTITLDKVYPSSEGAGWTAITQSSRYYIKGLALTVTGTCTVGVDKILFDEGGPAYAETATCLNDGTWTFSKNYLTGSQGDKTLNFQAYDIGNLTIAGTAATVQVRIDDTAPSAPVITVPGTSPFAVSASTSTFTINGTCSCIADATSKITGPAGVVITPTGDTWTFNADVTGDGTSYTFYSWDLAGNQSGATTQVFEKNQSLKLSGAIPGGRVTEGVSNYKMDYSAYIFPGFVVDGVSTYKVLTGFNYIINAEGHD